MPQYSAVIDLGALNGTTGFRLDGIDAGDSSGASVASAGDVNGDGFDDIIIGAQGGDPGGDSYAGESYVVFGLASGFAASLDLSTLDGTNGFRLDGIDGLDLSGFSVASAGDVNGDGFDDVVIGAVGGDPGGDPNAGETYVVFGKASGWTASLDLSTLDGTNGFRIDGVDAFDSSGRSVASAGDVNGDGFADLIIGAYGGDPGGDSSAGESYVVFGKASGFAASLDPSTLDGSNGFRLDGVDAFDYSGFSVASAGDVNGDGFADLIIGAFNSSPGGDNYAGKSYVVFGKASGWASSLDLSALDGTNGFRLDGVDAYDRSGFSVASAGDVNGDGFDDLIIGAYGGDPGGDSYAGESYVVFGKASGFAASLDLSTLDGTNGFRLDGIDAIDHSGFSVASAGDFNGDGFADLIIGADLADPGGDGAAGESYVVFGKASGFAASLDLSTLDGNDGFRLDGADANDRSGASVASAGDVNGDGFDDLLIGALFGNPGGDFNAGESYVVFGGKPGEAVLRTGTNIANRINGGDFGDILEGLDGADTLLGHDGIDFLDGGSGDDVLDGGSGDDFANYLGGVGVTIDLTIVGAQNTFSQGIDTLIDIENLIGSDLGDTLTGNGGVNSLYGVGGGDLMAGGGGGDFLFGEGGDDTIDGEGDADVIGGGIGADLLNGGDGDDTLQATASDLASGDAFNGDAGTDTLQFYKTGGGVESGVFYDATFSSIERFIAASGGSGGTMQLSFRGSQFGGGQLSTALEFIGNNAVTEVLIVELGSTPGASFSMAGFTFTNWDAANDLIFINAASGNESVIGSIVSDTISGLGGNDTLKGGAGADSLDGAGGVDIALYTDATGAVTVNLNSGTGTGDVAQGDVLTSIENVAGGNFNDVLTGAHGVDNWLGGGLGADNINGFSGNDTLVGGGGNDTLTGNFGADVLDGGAGTDMANYSDATARVVVRLWNGTGEGNLAQGDVLTNIENLNGSNFNDILFGADGVANFILGGNGPDYINGLSGADTLVGGTGNDSLAGGAGADRHDFSAGSGADRVFSFIAGAGVWDVVRITGYGAALDSFAEILAATTQVGADAVINLGGGNTITLVGTLKTSLVADDFTFI